MYIYIYRERERLDNYYYSYLLRFPAQDLAWRCDGGRPAAS